MRAKWLPKLLTGLVILGMLAACAATQSASGGRRHVEQASFHVKQPAVWPQLARFTWNTQTADCCQST